jgi:5-methylcytosine-specific restriction protein A
MMTNSTLQTFHLDLSVGETINNSRLVKEFQCSAYGGMRRSHKTNTLVLVSKHVISKEKIYDDRKDGDTYYYTGQGMEGDQRLDFGQNKTLAQSNTNNVVLHFFEVFEEGKYIYMGIVFLSGEPFQEIQEDQTHRPRKVWVFPLKLSESTNPRSYVDSHLLNENLERGLKVARKLSTAELEKRAIQSSAPSSSRKTYTKTYLRNPYIAEFTKKRANGVCELCKRPAPFVDKNGDPYLESHHIVWLSQKGLDAPENTVALCPNCHKRMHVRDDATDVATLTELRSGSAETDL